MSRLGSAMRATAQVAAFTVPLILVIGVLLALEVRHEQQTDGALTASYAAGVAVSPNTRLGVTAQGTGPGDSCCDLVWRIGAHPKLLAHFPGGAPLAFAPDGQTVAAASPAGVTLWSLADPAKPVRIGTLPGPDTAVGIASAPRRNLVAIAYPRTVQLWNLASPAAPHRIATIQAAANVPANCGDCSNLDYIAFSPDGRTLATTAARHAVSLWDVSTPWAPRHLATVGRDTGPIAALAFSPAGSQLAYLRQNGELTVFRLTDPAHTVQTAIPGPPATLAQWGNYALSYSPDGTRITAVVLIEQEGGGRTTCNWNTTSLSQPLPADCRSDHFSIPGAFTFTPGRAAIVGPDPRGAGKLSNTLSVWPPLPR